MQAEENMLRELQEAAQLGKSTGYVYSWQETDEA